MISTNYHDSIVCGAILEGTIVNKGGFMENIEITGVRYVLDEPTKKYVTKKIGGLDRFLPRHARKTFSAEVVLEEVNGAHGNKYSCAAKIIVPGKVIDAKDATVNMMAAVDIVEAKLSEQLRKYKEMSEPAKGWRARVARFKQRVS